MEQVLRLQVFALLTDDHLYGSTLHGIGLTDLVFQIAHIGIMEQFGVVAEANEGGGLDAGLGDIVDLQAAALVRRRLNTGGGLGQNGVQVAGGDAHTGRGMHHLDQVEQVLYIKNIFSS